MPFRHPAGPRGDIHSVVHAIDGYSLVRRGCPATGWLRSPDLLYVCAECAATMRADAIDPFACRCGAMSLDADAGRFGSKFGDDAILTYRRASES
jgi:hypothetical protein